MSNYPEAIRERFEVLYSKYQDYLPPRKQIQLVVNRSKRTAGVCWGDDSTGKPYKIEISHYVNPSRLDEVILHELSHASIGPHEYHNDKWVDTCKLFGIQPLEFCIDGDMLALYNYEIYCTNCALEIDKYIRYSKSVRSVESNPEYWNCLNCKEVGTLKVRKLNDSS